jgi:hypothetical protein
MTDDHLSAMMDANSHLMDANPHLTDIRHHSSMGRAMAPNPMIHNSPIISTCHVQRQCTIDRYLSSLFHETSYGGYPSIVDCVDHGGAMADITGEL